MERNVSKNIYYRNKPVEGGVSDGALYIMLNISIQT